MRRLFSAVIAGLLIAAPSFAANVDLGVKTSTAPTATPPYVGADVIPLVRGTAWNKIPATLLNPCAATTSGTVPIPPNDASKFLNGQCLWTTPASSGGITVNSTSITSGTTGRLLYDNAGSVGEAIIGAGLSLVGGTLTAPGGGGWGVVGTSVITSGTSGRLLYDNGGLLGELALGTGVSTWLTTPSPTNFAAALTGAITVPAGGTGATGITTNAIIKGNGTSPLSASALSDDGTKISVSEPLDLTSKAVEIEVANASSGGTVLNKLAKLTGAPATAVITATADVDGVIGVVTGSAGTTGNARIAVSGQVPCIFDTATTAGNFVGNSPTVVGDCRDLGSTRPSGAQTIGRVLSSNGGGGTYAVLLDRNYTTSGTILGVGVDNGTSAQSVTGTTVIGNTARLVKIAAGWTTGTLTLPAISAVAADTGICVADGAQYVDGSHTLTIQANASDSIGGGSLGAGSAVGPLTSPGGERCFRVSAAHNWTQDGIPTMTADADKIITGMGLDGLTQGVQTPAKIGASSANHAVPVDVAGASTYKVIPDCPTGGIGYTQSTDAFGCNAIAVSITAATPDLVMTPSPLTGTGTIGTTNPQSTPADGGSHSYTIVSGDLSTEVILASTFTAVVVPQATGSFAAGKCFNLASAGAETATSTTSTINGIAGATGLKLGAQGKSKWCSDGTNWKVAVSVPTAASQGGTTVLYDDGHYASPGGGGGDVTLITPTAGPISGKACIFGGSHSSCEWAGLTGKEYRVSCHAMIFSAANNAGIELGTGAGPTWINGAATYKRDILYTIGGGPADGTEQATSQMAANGGNPTSGTLGAMWDLMLHDINTGGTQVTADGKWGILGASVVLLMGFDRAASNTTAVTSIRFKSDVNVTSGTCQLYQFTAS